MAIFVDQAGSSPNSSTATRNAKDLNHKAPGTFAAPRRKGCQRGLFDEENHRKMVV